MEPEFDRTLESMTPLQESEAWHFDNDDENDNIAELKRELLGNKDPFRSHSNPGQPLVEVRLKYGFLLDSLP